MIKKVDAKVDIETKFDPKIRKSKRFTGSGWHKTI